MNETATNLSELLASLDAGVFEQKTGRILSDVAASVVETGKKGQVCIVLDMQRIAQSNQVKITHTLKYVQPTAHGKLAEDNATETPMYSGAGGKLTLFPEDQLDLLKDNKERA